MQFVTVLCFLQLLLGNTYVLEQPKGSDMLKESPVAALRDQNLTHFITTIDQCAFDAVIGESYIKKSTDLLSNCDVNATSQALFPEQRLQCDGSHTHLHLRGKNQQGQSLTTVAAVYPKKMCSWLLDVLKATTDATSGGGLGSTAKSF